MAEGMFGQVRSTSSSDASDGIESFTQKNPTPCRRKASAYAGIIFQSCSSRQRQRMVILERQLKILPTSVVRRSAGGARYLLRLLRGDNFLKDRVQVVRNFPVRIVRLKFAQIGDIADVIAFAGFFHIFPGELFAGHILNFGYGFKHRNAVSAPATEVINFAWTRARCKFLNCAYNVMAVNVVANLFGLVTKNGIAAAAKRNLYQIRKKSVQLNTGMRRPGQASTAKNTGIHAKVAPILLRHKIGGGF